MISILQYSFSRVPIIFVHTEAGCAVMAGAHLCPRLAGLWSAIMKLPVRNGCCKIFKALNLNSAASSASQKMIIYSTGVQRPLPVSENVSLMSVEYWFSTDLQLLEETCC